MTNEMTWNQKWDMHKRLRKEHQDKAVTALRRFRESMNQSDYDEYKKESKIANKHQGIAQMMFTKKYGRI